MRTVQFRRANYNLSTRLTEDVRDGLCVPHMRMSAWLVPAWVMSEGLSMAARREVTKKFAREYAGADKAGKGQTLDALVAATGWTRDHARRAIRTASVRVGRAGQQRRRPKPRKYSYDALVVLQEVWRLAGQPSGKYLAAVIDDTLERLVRFRELGKVQPRVTDEVLDELRSMSAATIDRYLKPHKAGLYPAAGLSGTRPGQILRSAIPTRTSMDAPITIPGFLELDTVSRALRTHPQGRLLVDVERDRPGHRLDPDAHDQEQGVRARARRVGLDQATGRDPSRRDGLRQRQRVHELVGDRVGRSAPGAFAPDRGHGCG